MPDTWRIINNLIERVEDPLTGKISELELDIPPYFYEEAKIVAELQGDELYKGFGVVLD